jgi:putative sigma-54 modulation protein
MEINYKSLKFDADQKLLDFAAKKVSKLERFNDQIISLDVIFSLQERPENKSVKLQANLPKGPIIIERNGSSFQDAIDAAVDAMKEKIVRDKEKRSEK